MLDCRVEVGRIGPLASRQQSKDGEEKISHVIENAFTPSQSKECSGDQFDPLLCGYCLFNDNGMSSERGS